MRAWSRGLLCRAGVVALVAVMHSSSAAYAAEGASDPVAARLSPLVALLGTVDDPEIQRDVLLGILQALEGRRTQAPPTEWNAVREKLLKHPNAEVAQRATQLAVLFGDPAAIQSLATLLGDATAEPASRETALQTLLLRRESSLIPQLHRLVADSRIRGPVIRALAAFDDPGTPAILIEKYASFSDAEKGDAISTLAARPASALALLGAIEGKQIPANDVSNFTVRQLLGLKNPMIQKKLEQVWGTVRPTSGDRAALVAEYRSQLTSNALAKADRSQGRLVYSKICGNCHRLFGEGRAVGPELTGSQRKNVEYLLENLIDPSAVVSRDYRVTVINTKDGRVLTGVVRQENENAVTLLTEKDQVIVPRDEIEERAQQAVSMMPEGILQKLSAVEVRDLFAYLTGDSQIPLPAP